MREANANPTPAQPIDSHRIALTFFDDRFATAQYVDELTLPELADEIYRFTESSKKRLPWLKLARFGEAVSAAGCYRTNANMLHITGVEVDYDGGETSFDQAIERLAAAGLRALVYASASYVKGVKEKWRVLCPVSQALPPGVRHGLVAMLNGVLGGGIDPASFNASIAFYYGAVNSNPEHRVEVLDGDFIDLRDDLEAGAIGKTPVKRDANWNGQTNVTPIGAAPSYSDAELDAMLDRSQYRNSDGSGNWHPNMTSVTASLVGRGLGNTAICERCGPFCDGGIHDPELLALIESARVKFGVRDPDIEVVNLLGADVVAAIGPPQTHAERLESTRLAAGPVEGEDEPPEPEHGDGLNQQALWLLRTRGYMEDEDAIVRLYATTLGCRTKPEAFARRYRAWQAPNPDKRSKRPIYATDLWDATPGRISLAGVRMRPDMRFPVYAEGGHTFKNTYRRPRHAAGGTVEPFMTFLEGFIPDPIERAWLLDWMAHKQARPEIPGTSIFLVADNEDGTREGKFGTGRGLFYNIVHRLYGDDYATTQDFDVLEGTSSQSVYNDWMHGAIVVTVDEAKTSPTAYRRGERNAAYEVLKNIVDPAPKKRSFKGKHRQAFVAMSYCSFIVATNHANAAAIPAHDRRFTVLRNGQPLLPEAATAIAQWTSDLANIGALARALASRDLTGFDMFKALETAGKAEMAELARSDVEELLADLMADETRGLAFTKQQLEGEIGYNFREQGSLWRGEFSAAWHQYCVGLRNEQGGPRRIRVGGTQRKLFCFRDRRRVVEKMPEMAIRREASKWGGIDPSWGLHTADGLGKKTE